MMCVTFNDNPCMSVISCYNCTNTYDETYITTFYNELSSFVQHILKHNVLIFSGDINTHISKCKNNKFCSRNSKNRNVEYLAEFSLKNKLICLYTKFKKRKNYGFTHNSKARLYIYKQEAKECSKLSIF